MKFQFSVGECETHQVDLSFDSWGFLVISVDGDPVIRKLLLYSIRPTKSYSFRVGRQETHDVVIEKCRKVVLGGMRRQTYKIFVDGRLAHQFHG